MTPAAPSIPAINFRITSSLGLGRGGETEKFNDNLAAIRALQAVEADTGKTGDAVAKLAGVSRETARKVEKIVAKLTPDVVAQCSGWRGRLDRHGVARDPGVAGRPTAPASLTGAGSSVRNMSATCLHPLRPYYGRPGHTFVTQNV